MDRVSFSIGNNTYSSFAMATALVLGRYTGRQTIRVTLSIPLIDMLY